MYDACDKGVHLSYEACDKGFHLSYDPCDKGSYPSYDTGDKGFRLLYDTGDKGSHPLYDACDEDNVRRWSRTSSPTGCLTSQATVVSHFPNVLGTDIRKTNSLSQSRRSQMSL